MNRAARGAVRTGFVGARSAFARIAGEQTGSRIQRLLIPGDDLTESLLLHEPLAFELAEDLVPRLAASSLRRELLEGEPAARGNHSIGAARALSVVERGRYLLIAEGELVESALGRRRSGRRGLRLGLRAGD